jgi:hypothetical protein
MTVLSDDSRKQGRPSCSIDSPDEALAKILCSELLPGSIGPANLVGRAESTIAQTTPTGVPQ